MGLKTLPTLTSNLAMLSWHDAAAYTNKLLFIHVNFFF